MHKIYCIIYVLRNTRKFSLKTHNRIANLSLSSRYRFDSKNHNKTKRVLQSHIDTSLSNTIQRQPTF